MTRAARCRVCGGTFEPDTRTGSLPTVCAPCDPEGHAERLRQREWSRQGARRRSAELVELRRRVAELEATLADRAQYVPHADRDALARAVRAVGRAEGREATRAALLALRDVAHSWADVLRAPTGGA